MKVQYVAEDGKAFETEQECKDYELQTSFGSNTEFVNLIDDIFTTIAGSDDRNNQVLYFDSEREKLTFCIHLARNFKAIREAYEDMVAREALRKAPTAKVRGRKKRVGAK